jgi:CheY-like chemotaxis protein
MAPAEPIHAGYETVLIVEDDALVRTYVIAQVRALGYRTLAATNATEALALIDGDTPIDLLFTDIVMPGTMNGRQLADEARRRRPGLEVLFTSGYAENAIVHHGRLDPGVLLLAKPYRKQQLAQMFRAALSAADDADNDAVAGTARQQAV